MNENNHKNMPTSPPTSASPSSRRQFLLRTAILSAIGTLASIAATEARQPWALFRDAEAASAMGEVPSTDPGWESFMRLSSYLTGHATLDPAMGRALYTALCEDDSGLHQHLQALEQVIGTHGIAVGNVEKALKTAAPAYAALPGAIMKAWYLGVVGNGDSQRGIAYETALMYAPIADVVVMPTFARGTPGYWASPPVIHAAV